MFALPCTLRDLVMKYLDINTYPRRYFFEVLSYFAKDEHERERLQEFASPEGQVTISDLCSPSLFLFSLSLSLTNLQD